jgi:rSAM/selenodomain-associated transferase 1
MTMAVLAKAPALGRVKTRLCPPCTPEQAAELAEAALVDTLTAVAATPAARRVLVLDGPPGPWLPAGFEVVPQRGGALDERLANAFTDVGDAAVLIGMDTPQLTTPRLAASHRALFDDDHLDAVLGPALDGGWWAIGLREPNPDVFLGVPMSTSHTYAAQRARLRRVGLRTGALPPARDVDRIEDAVAVAEEAPQTHFAATLRSIVTGARERETPLG